MKRFKQVILCLILMLGVVGCSVRKEKGNWLYQLPNQSHSQMMSYIIFNQEGDLIVIDGGTKDDMAYLVEQILDIREDGKVKAWFLTHYHKDHTGALAEYLMSGKTDLEIESIYYQFPLASWVEEHEPNRLLDIETIDQALEKTTKEKVINKSEIIDFPTYSVEVLRDVNVAIVDNAGNNSSLVYKVETDKQSRILFLGDLGEEGGEELLKDAGDKIINMDYVQVAHHGQSGVKEDVYQKINPKYCLWPTPDWLWQNDDRTYKTEETKEWLEKLHVKKNYIAKDGLYKIKVD